jgi:GntP family gluconate:H+ symporter
VTKKPIKKITIEQIYWGAVPFVIIQVLMVGLIIAFPGLVSSGLSKEPTMDADAVMQQLQTDSQQKSDDKAADAKAKAGTADEAEDPMKRMLESMKEEQSKKP